MPLFESSRPTLIIVFIFAFFTFETVREAWNLRRIVELLRDMSILKDAVELGHTLAEREVVIASRSPKRPKGGHSGLRRTILVGLLTTETIVLNVFEVANTISRLLPRG